MVAVSDDTLRDTLSDYSDPRECADRLIELALRGALEGGQFVLYYQPKLELNTGRVSGVDQLLLGAAAGGDVGVGADPLADRPVRLQDGGGPDAHRDVHAVVAAQAVLEFVEAARLHRALPDA